MKRLFAPLVALLMIVLPSSAHLGTGGSLSSALLSDGDACRYEHVRTDCVGNNGVSGTYLPYDDAFVASGAMPIHLGGAATLFPAGFAEDRDLYCDLEVLGTGNPDDNDLGAADSDALLDERDVDNGTGNGGLQPDGTWDDGGFGGACHIAYQDGAPSYATFGCGGVAHAEDRVVGAAVWIGAGCDRTYEGLVIDYESPVACTLDRAVHGSPYADDVQCAADYLDRLENPQAIDSFPVCGADGIVDAVNFGAGGGSMPDASTFPAGVPYPEAGVDSYNAACDGQALASVWVFDSIQSDDLAAQRIPVAGGWVDWSSGGASHSWTPGNGTQLPFLPGCLTPTLDDDHGHDGSWFDPTSGVIGQNDAGCTGPLDEES